MSYEITSESYGRRLPKITATADSTDDLATLGTDWAEGSTCTISDTTYKLDKVKGWVDPSSGGGGGGGSALVEEFTWSDGGGTVDPGYTSTDEAEDIIEAYISGQTVIFHFPENNSYSIPNFYTTVAAIVPPAEGSTDLGIGLNLMGDYQYVGTVSHINLLVASILENGKLFIGPYID